MSVYNSYKTIIVDVLHDNKYTDNHKFLISCFHPGEDNNLKVIQCKLDNKKFLDVVDKCSDQMLFTCDAIYCMYNTFDQKLLSNISDKTFVEEKILKNSESEPNAIKFIEAQKNAISFITNNMILMPNNISNIQNKIKNNEYIQFISKYLNNKVDINNQKLHLINMFNLVSLSKLLNNYVIFDSNIPMTSDITTCNKKLFGSLLGLVLSSPGFCNRISLNFKNNTLNLINNFSRFMIHNQNQNLKKCIIIRYLNSINYFDYCLDQHINFAISVIISQSMISMDKNSAFVNNKLYDECHKNPNLFTDSYFIHSLQNISKSIWLAFTIYNNADIILNKFDDQNLELSSLLEISSKYIDKYKDIILSKTNKNSNVIKKEVINILNEKIKNHFMRMYAGNMFIKSSNLQSDVSLSLLLTYCSNNKFKSFIIKTIYNTVIYNPNYNLEELKFNFFKNMFLQYESEDPICMSFIRIIETHNKFMKNKSEIDKICSKHSIGNSIIQYITNKDKILFYNNIIIKISILTMDLINFSINLLTKLISYIFLFIKLFLFIFYNSFATKFNFDKY